jgi:hypothetical protein
MRLATNPNARTSMQPDLGLDDRRALQELFERSAKYRTSLEFFDLLEFINRFPSLSPFNAFLIHMQNAGVRVVMSARKWAKYRRKPKYQARPLIILIPFGPVDLVYDIADTDGDPLPPQLLNPFATIGSVSQKTLESVVFNMSKDNIEYIEQNSHKSSAGFAQAVNSSFRITVNSSYDRPEKLSTIVHELAHIFCGHLGIVPSSWWKARVDLNHESREFEAESVSFVTCRRLGLATTSEAYLSDYVNKNYEVPSLDLELILTVSGYIESMCKPGFKSKSKRTGSK